MNRDDIIRMAREAGAMIPHMTWLERDLFPVFMRFAERVAAAEREECAKVCEEIEMQGHALWDRTADPEAQGRSIAASDCAAAIRARGEK